MNEIYKTSNQNKTVPRNSSLKLFQPLRTDTDSEMFAIFRPTYL